MSATTVIEKIKVKVAEAQVYAKFIAAAVGGLLTIGLTLIPLEWAGYGTIVVAILTAFSVWKFPNAETPKE